MKIFYSLLLALCLLMSPHLADAKLILGDTDDTLEIVTGSAVSTMHVHASWADITTTTLTPGMTNTLITTATTTTVVASPGASTQRQVKMLTVYNGHASSSNAVSVQVYDGTNRSVLVKYTLLAGETLQWSEDENFRVIDASGQIKSAVVADTELPAAAALATGMANPTVPGIGAFLMCYNGTTWDRCQGGLSDTDDGTIAGAQVPSLVVTIPYLWNGTNWVRQTGDATNGLDVDVTRVPTDPFGANADAASATGSISAKLRSIATAVELIDNAVSGSGFNITQMNGVNLSMNSGSHGTGTQRVSVAGPCSDPARITSAAISESTAATNEIVALNGSDLIYVCSYKVITTAANSLKWVRGTGTDCGTGTTDLEGAQPYAANGGVVESGGGHALFVVPAGNALCLSSSAATAHGGRVSYVRTATP